MSRPDYKKYMTSREWKEKRAEAIDFYKGTCQNCGCKSGSMFVHHIHWRTLGSECMEDLTLLCEACHKEKLGFVSRGAVDREFSKRVREF